MRIELEKSCATNEAPQKPDPPPIEIRRDYNLANWVLLIFTLTLAAVALWDIVTNWS